jgi:hypothetical protein
MLLLEIREGAPRHCGGASPVKNLNLEYSIGVLSGTAPGILNINFSRVIDGDFMQGRVIGHLR